MARTKTSGDVTVMFAFSSQIDCRWCFNNWVTIHDIPSNMESQGWSQFTLVLLDLTHDCWFSSANFLAKRYWNNGMTMDDPQSQILFILGVSGKLSWIIWMTQGVTVICGEFFLNSLISPVVIKASLPTLLSWLRFLYNCYSLALDKVESVCDNMGIWGDILAKNQGSRT